MSELKNKRILVTGGCGFIGSHIVDRLVNEGASVVILDNLSSGKLENIAKHKDKVKLIQKDLRDDKALDEALDGVELITHQAALRSVPKSITAPLEYNDVNVTGTLKLFIKAKEKGVKRIAFASSSSVYGERIDFPEKESDYPKPISPYAATKLIGEQYAFLFSKQYKVGVVSLRYFNVYGPKQALDDEYAVVIPKFINCLLNNKQPPIYDDGEQERDFSFVENVVDANILALTKPGVEGEVFNVGNGAPNSVNGLLASLNKIIGKDIKAIYLPSRAGDVRKTHADISKAKKLLGWQPRVSFEQGLQRAVEWFEKQRTENR
ncbi:MAG: SDR family oxidoreductase [Candidatus Omnitrophota bacterium]|jgi:UDP-glucose 4-epimerase